MATATATKIKTTRNGTSTREAKPKQVEAKPEAMKVEAELKSGIFKGKMVDLTISPDGSITHMSDPKITSEEREAWDWMMQATRDAVASAQALREQNVKSMEITERILKRLKGKSK